MDLATQILGKYAKEMVVIGTTVYTRLLRPPEKLCLRILACLGQLAKFGDSCPSCCTQ